MKRGLRIALRLVLSLAVGLVGTEVLMRALIWSDNDFGRPLRRAWRYAGKNEDDYWKLAYLFGELGPRSANNRYDSLLGWTNDLVEPETREHVAAARVGDRRPVLLYGDSFAQCLTEPPDSFQAIFARSSWSETHWLLNYGVGGFGLDQIYLMLRETLPDWRDRDPVVLVGVMVDDDMDRSLLSIRGWPKPRLVAGENGLELEESPVPPDKDTLLERHPVSVRSYLWKALVQGSSLLPGAWKEVLSGARARRRALQDANRPILAAIDELLRVHDVEAFFVVFHGESLLRREWGEERHEFLVRELQALGRPFVSSRRVIDADRASSGREVEDYFLHEGIGRGHYDALGNEVVFQAFVNGLEGRFDG